LVSQLARRVARRVARQDQPPDCALRDLVPAGPLRRAALRLANSSTARNPDLSDNISIVILCDVSANGSRRPLDLQRLTGLSSSRITRAVDKLEAVGLVARSFGTVADDHRGTVITLTPAGRMPWRVSPRPFGLWWRLRELMREIAVCLGDGPEG
jgi:DNA-binding MarR family transcriptional regulator